MPHGDTDVNIDSGNDSLPDGTQPLPISLLTFINVAHWHLSEGNFIDTIPDIILQSVGKLYIWKYCYTSHEEVSKIGFITVHGLNGGHIAPYTDIEFQMRIYKTYVIMKSKDWYSNKL